MCKRQHLDGLYAPGPAIRDPGRGQYICRPGQQEPARPVILINRFLYGKQQLGRRLYFIDDRAIQTTYEANRIGLGGIEDWLINQG